MLDQRGAVKAAVDGLASHASLVAGERCVDALAWQR
jgi:hypothetical protein